jgi:hypothetical protein
MYIIRYCRTTLVESPPCIAPTQASLPRFTVSAVSTFQTASSTRQNPALPLVALRHCPLYSVHLIARPWQLLPSRPRIQIAQVVRHSLFWALRSTTNEQYLPCRCQCSGSFPDPPGSCPCQPKRPKLHYRHCDDAEQCQPTGVETTSLQDLLGYFFDVLVDQDWIGRLNLQLLDYLRYHGSVRKSFPSGMLLSIAHPTIDHFVPIVHRSKGKFSPVLGDQLVPGLWQE